jgi:hypothetical protein
MTDGNVPEHAANEYLVECRVRHQGRLHAHPCQVRRPTATKPHHLRTDEPCGQSEKKLPEAVNVVWLTHLAYGSTAAATTAVKPRGPSGVSA